MAIASNTIWEMKSSATTGNVNGAGFNPANAGMLTDFAATSANTASPVITSASYNFVAGDANNYFYVKAGTNWTVGWYKIVSVAANAATLDASVGSVVLSIGTQGLVTRNTSVGCASVASPTGGTGTIDYSQTDTAVIAAVADFNAVGASVTLTSLTAGFTPVMVGNIFHQTTTGVGAFGVVGWYEVATYVNATTVTLDRTPNSGTASVNTTGYVGGAGRLNGLEDTFKTMIQAANIVWVKSGTYTFSASATTASTNATTTNANYFIGYTTLRGDACNGSSRPIFAMGANTATGCQNTNHINLSFTGTGTTVYASGTNNSFINCKSLNSSTANRPAFSGDNTGCRFIGCEGIAQNGAAISASSSGQFIAGCYFHDSNIGATQSNAGSAVFGCIFEGNTTSAISNSSTQSTVINCSIYGREAKVGIGINLTAANSSLNRIINNIVYGFITGVSVGTGSATTNISQVNDFFNNTADVSNWLKDSSDIAIDPGFVGASQLTGTAANTSGSVLTDGAANFAGVNDNVDFLHIISGTGVTVGVYLITGHTGTTLTVNNALGTSSSNNDVYWVSNGHNFQVGSALAGLGFPTFTNTTGSLTTSYPYVGAVVPQASATGAGPFSRIMSGF